MSFRGQERCRDIGCRGLDGIHQAAKRIEQIQSSRCQHACFQQHERNDRAEAAKLSLMSMTVLEFHLSVTAPAKMLVMT